MLSITLYKGCILNEKYSNVFSLGTVSKLIQSHLVEKTVLEWYLFNLPQLQFNIDGVYQVNSGTFVFDYEFDVNNNIYEFNYCKVEEYDDDYNLILKRYCFIQNISIVNSLVKLDYAEDVWSSYEDKIAGITKSYLNKSRIIEYSDSFKLSPYKLPVEYEGNKQLSIQQLFNDNYYTVLAEIQFYNKDAEGNRTYRKTDYFLIYNNANSIPRYFTTVEELISEISQAISNGKFGYYNNLVGDITITYDGYEIGDIYVFPYEFNLVSQIGTRYQIFTGELGEESFSVKANCYKLIGAPLKECYEITINNDFKNKFFGNFSTLIDFVSFGNTTNAKLLFSRSEWNINVLLSFENQLYDITEDYRIDVPFEALTSEKLSQLKVARELKNSNLDYARRTAISGIVFDQLNESIGGASNTASGILNLKTGNYAQAVQNFGQAAIHTNNLVQKPLESGFSLQNIADNRKAVNSKVYSSNIGIFGNSTNFLNCRFGLFLCKIDSINDDYVKESINELGYTTYQYIKSYQNLDTRNPEYWLDEGVNYNILGFETIDVYGAFPRNIALILNEIFSNGVKIWYDDEMREDNYV